MGDFRYYLRVRMGDCDGQKVVYSARYGDYVALAIFEFLRAIELDRELAEQKLTCQPVKQTIEWKAPARFDQVLELSSRVVSVGTTSFTIATALRCVQEDRLCASAETVVVVVDEVVQKKVAIPARHRDLLLDGGRASVVDHAGHLSAGCCTDCSCDLPLCM